MVYIFQVDIPKPARIGIATGLIFGLHFVDGFASLVGGALVAFVKLLLVLHLGDYLYRLFMVHKVETEVAQGTRHELGFKPAAGKKLAAPTALITGGAMGIGLGMATKLAEAGHDLVLWDINGPELEKSSKALRSKFPKVNVVTAIVNVGDDDAVSAAAKEWHANHGPIDLLILNAGIVNGQKVEDSRPQSVERLFKVNVYHLFNVTRHVLPSMRKVDEGSWKGRRRVVVIGSVAGFAGCSLMADYNGSKAAANIFAESLTAEVRGSNVDVTLVCPYVIDTGMFRGISPMRMFRMLTSEEVVTTIIEAVQYQKRLIVIPWPFFYINLAKVLLPWSVWPYVDSLLQASQCMTTFQGSDSQKKMK